RHTRFSRDWSSDVCSSDLSFRRAYHYLAAAKAVRDAEKDIHGRAMDHAFVHRQARRLAAAVVQACEEGAPAAVSGETEGAAGRRDRKSGVEGKSVGTGRRR